MINPSTPRIGPQNLRIDHSNKGALSKKIFFSLEAERCWWNKKFLSFDRALTIPKIKNFFYKKFFISLRSNIFMLQQKFFLGLRLKKNIFVIHVKIILLGSAYDQASSCWCNGHSISADDPVKKLFLARIFSYENLEKIFLHLLRANDFQ